MHEGSGTSHKHQAIAYFSAEYAIADDLPIYAGGLGILAGDIVLEASTQNRPFYAVGLVYHEAFTGEDPDQRPLVERLSSNGFELAYGNEGERLIVEVPMGKRRVKLQAWTKQWGGTRLVLLDARIPENDERDQQVSDHLYASDPMLAFEQEICLGIGGIAMLDALGFAPSVIHLNEGHTALAGLAVVLRHLKAHPNLNFEEALEAVRPRLVGTKHTLLSGAGIFLDWGSVERILGPSLTAAGATVDDLRAIASRSNGDFSGTKLLIAVCSRASGVSEIHVAEEKRAHAQSTLIPITNGVFRWRWQAAAWDGRPLEYDDAKFWAVHSENRHQLLDHVRQQTGKEFNPDWLTVVWARRMAAYKRPELLVSDLDHLARVINNADRPIQLVVAGQANPADAGGIELMSRVVEASRRPNLSARFAYLPHYNPVSAKFLVRGADLWLNTPIRGYEACGTSGMKASLNGALQLSTSDGWIDEVAIGRLGWELPDIGGTEAPKALYDLLEHEVAPLFYSRTNGVPHKWILKMRANMKLITEQFTAERMLADYYAKLYSHE